MTDKHRTLGPTALVTGGAQGIGRAICATLASRDLRVVSADLQHDATESPTFVEREDASVYELGIDVRSRHSIDHAVATVERNVGPIHVLVNNAGIIEVGDILEVDEQLLKSIFDINAFGMFRCTQTVAKVMKERRTGRIISISSIAGKGGRPSFALYAASKAAVINFTQSFALALAPHGITVNAVCPGIVATEMWEKLDQQLGELEGLEPGAAFARRVAAIPLGREERPEDVAAMVGFLASEDADYITGQSMNVDGGLEVH